MSEDDHGDGRWNCDRGVDIHRPEGDDAIDRR